MIILGLAIRKKYFTKRKNSLTKRPQKGANKFSQGPFYTSGVLAIRCAEDS